MIAFTLRGFWQSRRNRVDLAITVLGVLWIVAHFVIILPAAQVMMENENVSDDEAAKSLKNITYKLGYLVVIMRFFTIAGRKSTLKMLMLVRFRSLIPHCHHLLYRQSS